MKHPKAQPGKNAGKKTSRRLLKINPNKKQHLKHFLGGESNGK